MMHTLSPHFSFASRREQSPPNLGLSKRNMKSGSASNMSGMMSCSLPVRWNPTNLSSLALDVSTFSSGSTHSLKNLGLTMPGEAPARLHTSAWQREMRQP